MIALALAGCADKEGPAATNAIVPGTVTGTVTDAALLPLAGVNVTLEGGNASALTDAAGLFSLETLPGEYVVLAQHADYKPGALRASVLSAQSSTLSFTLEAIPRIVPRVDVAEASGYLACHVLVYRAGERTSTPCGDEDPNDAPSVEFSVMSHDGLETAVLEIAWEATSDAGRELRLRAASRNGDKTIELGVAEGVSPLTLPIAGRLIEGDTLILTVGPAGSFLDEEAGADMGLVLQQPFTAYASLFYHATAPGGYSALSP